VKARLRRDTDRSDDAQGSVWHKVAAAQLRVNERCWLRQQGIRVLLLRKRDQRQR